MDGKAQDQFEHWIEAGAQGERINLTYRWIKRHNPSCVRHSRGVVVLAVLCGRLSVHRTPKSLWVGFFPLALPGHCPVRDCGRVLCGSRALLSSLPRLVREEVVAAGLIV